MVIVLEAEDPLAGGARFSLSQIGRIIFGRGEKRQAEFVERFYVEINPLA